MRKTLIAVAVLTVAIVGLLAVRMGIFRPYGPPPKPPSQEQVEAVRLHISEAMRSEVWADRIRSIEARVRGNGIQVFVVTDLSSDESSLADEIAKTALREFGTGSVEVRSIDGGELATVNQMVMP